MKLVLLTLAFAVGTTGCLTGEGGPLPRTSDAAYRAMADEACTSFVRFPVPAYTGTRVTAEMDRLSWLAGKVRKALPREPAPTRWWRQRLHEPVERMQRSIGAALQDVQERGSARAARHVPRAYAGFYRDYLAGVREAGLQRCLGEEERLAGQERRFRRRAARICRAGTGEARTTIERLDPLAPSVRLRRLWRETLRSARDPGSRRLRDQGSPVQGFTMLGLPRCADLF